MVEASSQERDIKVIRIKMKPEKLIFAITTSTHWCCGLIGTSVPSLARESQPSPSHDTYSISGGRWQVARGSVEISAEVNRAQPVLK
jgi:hypothetical protein